MLTNPCEPRLLKLGEHMLSKEYFPHHKLDMSPNLKKQLISYYDFLVAYQNLLRDVDVTDAEMEIQTPADIPVSSTAEQGKIWTFSKQRDNQRMLHLINFADNSTMEWRDTEASQPIPVEKKYLEMVLKTDRKPKKIWFASPDVKGGLPQKLSFTYKDGAVSF
ncbi:MULTISPECIES: glycoside hydrolase family 66 protein [unclassified Bacillus (in: firmicutes)]|uniref:glycoside hydrolase family 66 protein n=1 Tax=Bacillus sp. cl95 TaxID=1761761 RepID=UPI001C315D39|nr:MULTISPECIES: glycoside hydrolase family 66 protein [unclassified Bacillus (in: firmicutes)]